MKFFFTTVTLALLIPSAIFAQADSLFMAPALNEMLYTTNGDSLSWEKVVQKTKGQVTVIDVWATWCKDCIVGFPDLKKIQQSYQDKNVKFMFLSIDRTQERWKQGIDFYSLKGDHYFVKKGWKGDLSKAMKLDWIPRYIVLSPDGKVALFRAIKSDDPLLTSTIDALLK